ncbi:FadR/GntR family transcriptional regulator [Alicyclobacillus ferrooxydans]|uniref:HTH gntR-type domain-containing protein n=1 Tax=Alicyclobacillus ferrooxydans TaxID=471514 RepID=A0A0P9D6V1_9BACL|nr:FadR/GntR family transcriptional regulator [Alicyclobacillus ferrooxydans]KPV45086.1 hypothetical protein AN477_03570 [Alicyclobacillus ferrooxydans]
MFEPISDNVALSQKIVAKVTDAITRGELRPGDRLPTEREMAAQFQVSRTSIRDAIKILTGRGLLTVKHGVGIFVADPNKSIEDSWAHDAQSANLRDLFEIRKMLETEASFYAAERASDEDIKRISEILDEALVHESDLQSLSLYDARFHVAIAEASKNLLLVKVMWSLLESLEEGRRSSLEIPGRAAISIREHQAILKAITEHDSNRARNAMLAHLTSVEGSVQSRPVAINTEK